MGTAPLSVTANARSKSYGQVLTLGTTAFTTSGLVNGDTVSGVTLTSSGAAATAAVGSYSIVPSAATGGTFTAANYSVTYNPGSLTVSAAPLTVTANSQSKSYGQTLTLGTTAFNASGLVNGDTVTGVTLTSTGAAATATLDSYNIVPSAATGGTFTAVNYSITYTPGALTVTAAPLTVTANNASMTYGGTVPTLAGSLGGVVNGDSITASYTTTATSSTPVGTYPITPVLNDPNSRLVNYSVNSTSGTLTINKATPTLAVVQASPAGTPVYGSRSRSKRRSRRTPRREASPSPWTEVRRRRRVSRAVLPRLPTPCRRAVHASSAPLIAATRNITAPPTQ